MIVFSIYVHQEKSKFSELIFFLISVRFEQQQNGKNFYSKYLPTITNKMR